VRPRVYNQLPTVSPIIDASSSETLTNLEDVDVLRPATTLSTIAYRHGSFSWTLHPMDNAVTPDSSMYMGESEPIVSFDPIGDFGFISVLVGGCPGF
jgi:hypothetical protein